ncbi:TPA: YkvA family protein [Streptococcus suis]
MTQQFSKAEANEAIKKNYRKAEKILQNKDDFEHFLQSVEKKLHHVPVIGSDLAVVPAMISLVRHFAEGRYRHVPIGTILAIVSSLIYFVSPVDVIPEVLPVVGLVDDALVIKVCLEMVKSDLEIYDEWRIRKGLLEGKNK